MGLVLRSFMSWMGIKIKMVCFWHKQYRENLKNQLFLNRFCSVVLFAQRAAAPVAILLQFIQCINDDFHSSRYFQVQCKKYVRMSASYEDTLLDFDLDFLRHTTNNQLVSFRLSRILRVVVSKNADTYQLNQKINLPSLWG